MVYRSVWITKRFNTSDIYMKTLKIVNTGTGDYGFQENEGNKKPFWS